MEQNRTILPQLNGLPHFKAILDLNYPEWFDKIIQWVGYFIASKCLSRNEMTDFFFFFFFFQKKEVTGGKPYLFMTIWLSSLFLAWLLLNLCQCVCTSSSLSSALSILTSWKIWRSGYSQQSSIEWSSWFFCYLNSVFLPIYVAIGNNET